MRLPHLALWRRFGGAQPPTYSPRYRCEYVVTAPEEHDRLATRLRRSRRHCGLRRNDMASVQGLSFPQEAFRSPPGLLRGLRRDFGGKPRRDRHKKTHKPEVNQTSPITAQSHENMLRRSRPARNRNAACRKPSCLARTRQTAGVNRTQDIPIETYDRHEPNAKRLNQRTKACTHFE